jgi:hypothetical protein
MQDGKRVTIKFGKPQMIDENRALEVRFRW